LDEVFCEIHSGAVGNVCVFWYGHRQPIRSEDPPTGLAEEARPTALTRHLAHRSIAAMLLERTNMPRVLRVAPTLMLAMSFIALTKAQAASWDAKERAAKIACLKGDYAKGVGLLAELYVSTPEAVNQGRCFEQNGKYEEAILRFREFQRKNADAGLVPSEQADRHAQAEKHIAECQALLDKQKPAAAGVAPPVAQPVPPPAPVVVPVVPASPPVIPPDPKPITIEPGPEVAASPKPAEPASPGLGLRVAGIVSAAVGLGGIATGVILNVKANNLVKDLQAANNSQTTLYSRDKESSRSSYQTWAWVAYGAGAACLAGSVVIYYLGYRESQVALVPTVANGRVGASLQGAF
jgi:hypothetical protein